MSQPNLYVEIRDYLESIGYDFVDFGNFAKSDTSMMISAAWEFNSGVNLWLTSTEGAHKSAVVVVDTFEKAKSVIDLMDFAIDQHMQAMEAE